MKKIKSALISVYHKEGLEEIVSMLDNLGVELISTGGTFDFISGLNINVKTVESLTSYPSILGGRVKTLHPKVFGGILGRRELEADRAHFAEYDIPEIDLVIVDLYPFEETLASINDEAEIIEKIDIGGISLIRAAAKNFRDVLIVPSMDHYTELLSLLKDKEGSTELEDRKRFAAYAFNVSSHYDTAIFNFFDGGENAFKLSFNEASTLRYGENPHQQGVFYGKPGQLFEQLHGKAISYNNLGDLDAAIGLIDEFSETTFAILKHNNACGLAQRDTIRQAYIDALAGDPVSAFGGVLIANKKIDKVTAEEIHKLFCEVVIAPEYDNDALEILKGKKNRIILLQKDIELPKTQFRTALNGVLSQEKDSITDNTSLLKQATELYPSEREIEDLLFASKICKNTKSNTIVLVKNKQLCASGTGQTSRIDALNQSVIKANNFNFDLKGAVMASDAFFPFPDSVEIADNAGITAVIQPGGSIKDQLSIDYCNDHKMSMVFTGIRHFKH